jgi:hypothetical protein
MSSKFEQLLDYLVNEEHEKADALFHEIVVEKSREIYENLIAEEEETDMEEAAEDEQDESVEEASEEEDESMDEASEEEDESMDETVESMFGEEEEEEFPVQDKTDDAEDDFEMPGMGDEEGDTSAPADKGDIQDLEDALEELKAEFEALMAAEHNEEENEPGVHDDEEGNSPLDGMDDGEEDGEEDDESAYESSEEDEESAKMESRVARTQGEKMREYIEKVSVSMVDGGGVGSGTGDKAGQTGHDAGKSPVSSGSGKPTSGANAKNIAQGGKGVGEMSGTSTNMDKGSRGLVGATKGEFTKAGTKNVASSANAKKPDGAKLSSVAKPSNKEFAGVGAATGGDKAGQTGSGDTKSPLTGAPNRAK